MELIKQIRKICISFQKGKETMVKSKSAHYIKIKQPNITHLNLFHVGQ